jgi:formylglycine-generating enzyme required for sulfatase activity
VYCNKRSIKEGRTPCYTIKGSTDPSTWGTVPTSSDSTWNAAICDFTANGFRLPTEAEWEYAAKGGQKHKYSGSNNIYEVAWYEENSGKTTHPVAQKKANGYGLYDMSGNVWEWCWGTIGSYHRLLRGGSWDGRADGCTVSYRNGSGAYNRFDSCGLRVVRTAE